MALWLYSRSSETTNTTALRRAIFNTPRKIHMEPENDALEDDFPFPVFFSGSILIFGVVILMLHGFDSPSPRRINQTFSPLRVKLRFTCSLLCRLRLDKLSKDFPWVKLDPLNRSNLVLRWNGNSERGTPGKTLAAILPIYSYICTLRILDLSSRLID